MKETTNACVITVFALAAILACAHVTHAQIGAATRPSGQAGSSIVSKGGFDNVIRV